MKSNDGFTLVELMVTVVLFSIVATAGYMLLVAGQAAWSVTGANIQMQQDIRQVMQRVSLELQESGTDSLGAFQVSIDNGAGIGGSDLLRFAIPICPCYSQPIDSDGNVQHWGAPLQWGKSGCSDNYPLENNGKVHICHFPPGNPTNPQDLNVSVNAVQAHMTNHGDLVGDCDDCYPIVYNNRWVEYRIDGSNRLVRRVLTDALTVLNETVIGHGVEDFQATLNPGQTAVSLTLQLSRDAAQNRNITMVDDIEVILRN